MAMPTLTAETSCRPPTGAAGSLCHGVGGCGPGLACSTVTSIRVEASATIGRNPTGSGVALRRLASSASRYDPAERRRLRAELVGCYGAGDHRRALRLAKRVLRTSRQHPGACAVDLLKDLLLVAKCHHRRQQG